MARVSLGMPEFSYLSRSRQRAPAEGENTFHHCLHSKHARGSAFMHPLHQGLTYISLFNPYSSARMYIMLSIALKANAETETQVTCPVGLSQPMEPGSSGSRVHAFHPHITCSGRTEAADLRACCGVSLETPEYPFTPFLSWVL